MISAGTLHVVATELAIGMISLAGISIALRLFLALKEDEPSRLAHTLDSASLVAAIGGLAAIPLAIFTGAAASPGEGMDDPLLFNKVLLSWMAIGLWGVWIHGRVSMGPMLWNNRNIALFQGLLGMAACGCVLTIASLGGKYTRGESLLGPLSKPLEYSIAIGNGGAILALLASAAALASVIWMMPKPKKVE
tara:strand:+ start:753 stop:1328 length:576 start_codon:yes stop_codon:yes gene_type:complete